MTHVTCHSTQSLARQNAWVSSPPRQPAIADGPRHPAEVRPSMRQGPCRGAVPGSASRSRCASAWAMGRRVFQLRPGKQGPGGMDEPGMAPKMPGWLGKTFPGSTQPQAVRGSRPSALRATFPLDRLGKIVTIYPVQLASSLFRPHCSTCSQGVQWGFFFSRMRAVPPRRTGCRFSGRWKNNGQMDPRPCCSTASNTTR
jgi:hypothetical protein